MSDEIQKVYVQAAVEVTDKFLHISRSVYGLFTDKNILNPLNQSGHERSRHRLGMGWTNVHPVDK